MILDYEFNNAPADWFYIKKAFPIAFANSLLEFFPEAEAGNNTGKRDGSNEYRTFITKEIPKAYDLFEAWNTLYSKQMFSDLTGIDCTRGKLRIELCQDAPGFWLEKHIDIPEKLITLQIYLGDGDVNWGTSLYHSKGSHMTVPFVHNQGWLTVAGSKCVHGVEPDVINGIRRSIIINYVVGDWRDTEQLY